MVLSAKATESAYPAGCDDAPASGVQSSSRPAQSVKSPLERLRLLVRTAVRRVARSDDYEFEDLVQASLASVLTALGPRRVESELSAPWVLCVARNVAIDRM